MSLLNPFHSFCTRKLRNQRSMTGRSSGSLHFDRPSHLNRDSDHRRGSKLIMQLTAAGTAADFHGIPLTGLHYQNYYFVGLFDFFRLLSY